MTQAGVFRRTRTIEKRHVDRLLHVNNVVWVELIIELAQAHWSALGLDHKPTPEAEALWIIRRHEIDYHHPALAGDEILEETWLASLRGARSIRNSRFTRVRDSTRLVSAVTHWAYIDARTQRPRRIDPQILSAVEVLKEAP